MDIHSEQGLERFGIVALSSLFDKKALSPVEVTEYLLHYIMDYNPPINAFVAMTPDQAMEQAKASERRMLRGERLGAFDGIPFAVKDIIWTKDAPTTAGCEIYRDFRPARNAFVVDRLCNAGGIMLGKTNTHQFALLPTGDRSCFGPVHNPRNLDKMSGGSSSGSAAAVAADFVPAAVGTDTGGSVRIPSAMCGIVGMRVTHGLVSLDGCFEVSNHLDTIGPLTRSVMDNAVMLGVMAGYDPRDPFSQQRPEVDYTRSIGKPLAGLKVGIPYSYFEGKADAQLIKIVLDAVALLKQEGAELREVKLPENMADYMLAQKKLVNYDIYKARKADIANHRDLFDPEVLERMETLCSWQEYEEALRMQREFIALIAERQKSVDVMALPTLGTVAPDIHSRTMDLNGAPYSTVSAILGCCWLASLAKLPAMSLPCGQMDGLPVGLQLVGRPWSEEQLYQVSARLENLLQD